jgi:hypothetical protein
VISAASILSCLQRQRGLTSRLGLKSCDANQRDGLRYASDTAAAEWGVIEPHLPPPARCGRTRKTGLREVVDAIFYIAQTGCQWRLLPKDFPTLYNGAAVFLPVAEQWGVADHQSRAADGGA